MRGLNRHIIYFLVPVFLVWAGLEWFYRTQPNNYTYKDRMVERHYQDTEVLILGSSHAFFGLDPEHFIQPAYNLSNISQSLYFDELLLQKHLDSMPGAQAVVLPIGYFSLSQEEDGLEDRWRKYFYDQQMDLQVPSVPTWDIRRYSLALSRRFDRSVDLVRTKFRDGTLVSCYPNGYGIQDSTSIVKDKAAISRIIARKHEDGSLDFEAQADRLGRMMAFCNQRDVALITVLMPAYPDYYNLLRKDKWEKIKRSLDSLQRVHENAFFLDLSRDGRFTKKDLRDADHLTNEGAARCSAIISDFIRKEI